MHRDGVIWILAAALAGGAPAIGFAAEPARAALRTVLSVQLVGPETHAAQKPARYAIEVQNEGNTAVPMELEARCGSAVRVVSSTPTAAVSGSTLRWQLEAIAPGGRASVSFELAAQTPQAISVEVIARPAIAVSLQTPIQRPELELTVRGPRSCEFGQTVVCTATVTNRGSVAVDKGGLLVFASRGVRVRPNAPNQGPFQLAPGKSLETPIVLELTGDGPQGLKVQAEAEAGATATAEHRFLVRRPRVDVDFEGPSTLTLDQTAVYRLTVTNVGTSPVARAYGFIELPENLAVAVVADGGTHDERRRLVYWPADGLEPRRRLQFTLTLKPLRPGPFELRASAKETTGTDAEAYLAGSVSNPMP